MTFLHDDTARAIYLDFEALATEPHPTPHLLGALCQDRFEQWILDPRLHPGQVASRHCRTGSLHDAIRDIVSEAEAGDRLILGWSFFDRDLAKRACPPLAGEIEARYRNVIQTARPWRQRVYPSVAMPREDDFAPRHTLAKYAKLAGYPGALQLANATPAGWIRSTLDRMRKAGGRYRALSPTGKRQWHQRLEYNRHDCLRWELPEAVPERPRGS